LPGKCSGYGNKMVDDLLEGSDEGETSESLWSYCPSQHRKKCFQIGKETIKHQKWIVFFYTERKKSIEIISLGYKIQRGNIIHEMHFVSFCIVQIILRFGWKTINQLIILYFWHI